MSDDEGGYVVPGDIVEEIKELLKKEEVLYYGWIPAIREAIRQMELIEESHRED